MSENHLAIVRRLAAELATANTLFVSAAGPQRPSPNDEGGPSTWWSNLAGALSNAHDHVPATTVEDPASGPRSTTPVRFDLLVVDPEALSNLASANDLVGAVAVSASYVALLEPSASNPPIGAEVDLIEVASDAGFEVDSRTIIDRRGVADLLVPGHESRAPVGGHAEPVAATQAVGAVGCEDAECHRRVSVAERQAMVDRDRVLGVLARSLHIQYDLDHHRIALARVQRQLAATERKLEASRKQLRRLRRSRKYRLANAMSNPVATMKARRGKKPDAPASSGTKGIGS